jgi:hypothetical protein
VIEHASEQLQRHVLEGQRRAVEQFQLASADFNNRYGKNRK